MTCSRVLHIVQKRNTILVFCSCSISLLTIKGRMGKKKDKERKQRTVETVCGDCGTEIMHWKHFAAAGKGIMYISESLSEDTIGPITY